MDASSLSLLRNTGTGPTWRRYFSDRLLLHIAISLCIALLLGFVLSYAMLVKSGNGGTKHTDFIPYYSSAHLVLDGHGGKLYDFRVLGKEESALVRPFKVRDGVMPYLYPPYFATFLAPLAALPYGVAYLLWLCLNSALLGALLFGLQKYANLGKTGGLLLWAASLSFLPVFVTLVQGQTSILVLALLATALLSLRRGWQVSAGLALGFAMVKPTYLAPIVGVLVLRRCWKPLVVFLGTAVSLLASPVPFLGASVNREYLHTLQKASGWTIQIGGFEPRLNHSFAGFTQLLFQGTTAKDAALVLGFAALLPLVRCSLHAKEIDGPFALAVVAGLLVSPHVLAHDLALLLLPISTALRFRSVFPAHLPLILGLGYIAMLAGFRIAFVAPVQLSVLAMSSLAVWLYVASTKALPTEKGNVERLRLLRAGDLPS